MLNFCNENHLEKSKYQLFQDHSDTAQKVVNCYFQIASCRKDESYMDLQKHLKPTDPIRRDLDAR